MTNDLTIYNLRDLEVTRTSGDAELVLLGIGNRNLLLTRAAAAGLLTLLKKAMAKPGVYKP